MFSRIFFVATIFVCSSLPGLSWEHAASTSPIDDSTIYQISTSAAEATIDRFGTRGTVDLVIQCESNTTLFALIFSDMYMSDHGRWGDAVFRIDDSPAFSQRMLGSNDNTSLALRGGNAIKVIKKFIGAERLFVRTLPVNENFVDLTFRISGAEAALKSIREKCGW